MYHWKTSGHRLENKNLEVYADSILIISQVSSEWAMKSLELTKYHKCLTNLKDKFRSFFFLHVSRSRNHFADALVGFNAKNPGLRRLGLLMSKKKVIQPIVWMLKGSLMVSHGIMMWRSSYKREFILPVLLQLIKKTVRRLACQFFLNGDILLILKIMWQPTTKMHRHKRGQWDNVRSPLRNLWSAHEWSHVSTQNTSDGILLAHFGKWLF